MRKAISVALAVLLLPGLTAGSCDKTSDGKSQPAKNGGPNAARPPVDNPPNPDVNVPGPVRADPNACDGGGTAEFRAGWATETRVAPKIEYSIGGGQITATNVDHRKTEHGYGGIWVFEVHVACGQTIGFSLFGTPSSSLAVCYIIYKGETHGLQQSTRNCASSLTIPAGK